MDRLRRTRHGIAWESALAVLLLVPAAGHTQIAPTDEYSKLIAAGQSIQPMGTHPFGESVNLYNGSLSFEVTDVSVPGIGPVLQLSRSLDDADPTDGGFNRERPFGEWHLDIPRMETMTAFQGGANGSDVLGWWVWTSGVSGYLNRCTQFRAPPPAQASDDYLHWDPTDWWYGYFLIVPGQSSQYVGSGFASTINGVSYSLGTKQNWRIACGVTASDGGEGFLAVAPDGTRYTFNHLIYRPATSLERNDPLPPGDGGPVYDVLTRRDGLMYVTEVEDRFGNTLTYNWSNNNPGDPVNNHLTSIVASDGRELDLAYYPGTPLVQTVTVKAAAGASASTWTYSYDTSGNEPSLTKVQLPDGSAWVYQLGNLYKYSLQTDGVSCPSSGSGTYSIGASGGTGSVTAPSGLTATFTVTPMFHGRSYVPQQCNTDIPGGNPPQDYFPITPDLYGQFSLTKEVLSGPGIPTETWTYSYSSPNQSWTTDPCAGSKTCPTTVYTDVTDPLGHDVRYTYSNRFDYTEGQLLRTDSYSGAAGSTDLRSVVNAYANPSGQTWPTAGGIDVANVNFPQIDETSPLQNGVITQDGATFTTHINAFDNLARATSTTGSSSLGYSKTDTMTYADDSNRWVLGMVTQTATNSTVFAQTSYTSLDLPYQQYAFGKLISTKAWNTDGTLASVTDGNNHAATFSNWYRSVPETIGYADGTSQSAVVNGNGWITSITDENGFATSYRYDAMGRLASITYPSGDDVAWNQTLVSFAPLDSAYNGIPAGAWNQGVRTGNGFIITYFDAFWRPILILRCDSTNFVNTVSNVVMRYDTDGRLIFRSYPTGNISDYTAVNTGTHFSYDALGRVTEVDQDSELGTLKTLTSYLSGFKTQVTDPRGYITTTSYQAFGEPSTQSPVSITTPEGQLTVIMRDAFGKPLSITRTGTAQGSPQVTRYYVYDGYQQLCKRIDPESGASAFGYDGAGNLLWSASGLSLTGTTTCDASSAYGSGRRVDRAWDARNRLLTLTFPDGIGNQSLSYYPDGMTKQINTENDNGTGAEVVNAYLYDKRRLLTSESTGQTGWYTWPIGYGYDANGHLGSEVYPDGLTITYMPNALGQSTQIGSYVSGISYWPDGNVKQFSYGNGIVRTLNENTRLLPSRLTDSGGGVTPIDQSYSYDADGDLTALSDAGDAQQNRTLTYDGLDRLASGVVSYQGGTPTVFQYDVLDNLVEASFGATVRTYGYDGSNRLVQVNDNTYGNFNLAYDAQGNVVSKNGLTYGINFGNRLFWVSGRESYRYDGLGRRVLAWSVLDQQNILSQYTLPGQLAFQGDWRDGSGYHNYLYLGGHLVAIVDQPFAGGSSVRYQHTDSQGSVVAQTDAGRNIVDRSVYSSWGGLLNHANDDQPGYTGHLQDSLTGLTYMQQRYYMPDIQRFASADPVGVDPSAGENFNRYWYAGNNPYKFTDPDGRAFGLDDLVGSGVGGLVGMGVEAAKDLYFGEPITKGDMAGAFVGGALMGEGIVNAPETLGGSVVAAAAVRGAAVGLVSNTVQQGTDIASGEQKGYSVTSVVVSTAVGAVTGGVLSKVGTVKVPGVTAGRNSMAAVAKAVKTRIANGNASNMSAKTMVKGVIGSQVGNAGRTVVGGAIGAANTKVCQQTSSC